MEIQVENIFCYIDLILVQQKGSVTIKQKPRDSFIILY